MASVKRVGTIVVAPVRIAHESINYPVAYAEEINGGVHSGDLVGDRDALPLFYRAWGMRFNVRNDGANSGNYFLQYNKVDTNLANNANWAKESIANSAQIMHVIGESFIGTAYNNAALINSNIAIFFNSVQRFLVAQTEWVYTATGISITMSRFDSTIPNQHFYIYLNVIEG